MGVLARSANWSSGSAAQTRRPGSSGAPSALFPGYPAVAIGLAKVALARGDAEEASAIARRQFEHAPSAELAEAIGDAATRLGRTAEAERYYGIAESMWRYDTPEPAMLARFLADRGRAPEEAVRIAESAAAVRHDIFTEDALAWALFKAGRITEARAASARARRTGSRDARIVAHAREIDRRRPRTWREVRRGERQPRRRARRRPSLLHLAAPAQAHELGANRVEITVSDDGRYDIAIVSNPEALLARLELLHGDAADIKKPAGTDGERLARLGETLLAHLHLRADDVEMRPELVPGFHRVPAAEGTGPADNDEWAVRLRGRLPAGAERITWQCGFIYGSYAVVVRAPAVSVQWTYASERTAAMSARRPRAAVSGRHGLAIRRAKGSGTFFRAASITSSSCWGSSF